MKTNETVDVKFVWQIHDRVTHLTFRKNEIGEVMLPFIVIRRMDAILEPVAKRVRETFDNLKDKISSDKLGPVLRKASGGRSFYNVSKFQLKDLLNDAKNIDLNFRQYLNGFNEEVRNILENYQFDKVVAKLTRNGLLYQMIQEICALDLSEKAFDNHKMGYVFEEIIRIANEEDNQQAGEHFTPRDMIALMCALVFNPDKEELDRNGIIRTIYDPTCGTGGMVNLGKRYIKEEICTEGHEPTIVTYGQELNEQSFAIAKSEAMITGENADNIALGNTITDDKFKAKRFHYIMANPPYGVTWKSMLDFVTFESHNPDGRFSVGIPRTSDGQFLFIQHMISKMEESGSRIGVVTNGSPLFSGGAGSGESNIRKWIIENDLLEAIVALPENLFYNTGIFTYIWILTNKKVPERKGKVQLINATKYCVPNKKTLGSKRNEILDEHIQKVWELYLKFENSDDSKIFNNRDLGYFELTIEQPLRDDEGKIVLKAKKPVGDSSKRDIERIGLDTNWEEYFKNEVLPHIDPESWVDLTKTKIGYEIPFTRYFYKFEEPKKSSDIRRNLEKMEEDIVKKFSELFTTE